MNPKIIVVALAGTFCLSSCGVYQIATHDSQKDPDGYEILPIAMAPVLLITGDYPDTTAKNFKPFSYYAGLIKGRNGTDLSPGEVSEILVAMDRCFRLSNVKKMSEKEVISNFGSPDKTMMRNGSLVFVFQIKRAKGQPERWLVHD